MTDMKRDRLAAEAAEHGGELIRADELRVGDDLQLAAGRGASKQVRWCRIVALDVKSKQVWLTVQLPGSRIEMDWRPARDDELVARRG